MDCDVLSVCAYFHHHSRPAIDQWRHTRNPGVSGGAFGGYTQSNVAARRVVPTEEIL